MRMGETEALWQDQVYDLLRQHNVTQFAYVPDAGHRILIDRSLADPGVHSVALTTEEEGVALLAGRRPRRRARRAADAEQRGGQLHQHAVADQGRRLSVPDARQHARRLRRGQSVAVSHGPGDPAGAGGHGRDLPARRDPA